MKAIEWLDKFVKDLVNKVRFDLEFSPFDENWFESKFSKWILFNKLINSLDLNEISMELIVLNVQFDAIFHDIIQQKQEQVNDELFSM